MHPRVGGDEDAVLGQQRGGGLRLPYFQVDVAVVGDGVVLFGGVGHVVVRSQEGSGELVELKRTNIRDDL